MDFKRTRSGWTGLGPGNRVPIPPRRLAHRGSLPHSSLPPQCPMNTLVQQNRVQTAFCHFCHPSVRWTQGRTFEVSAGHKRTGGHIATNRVQATLPPRRGISAQFATLALVFFVFFWHILPCPLILHLTNWSPKVRSGIALNRGPSQVPRGGITPHRESVIPKNVSGFRLRNCQGPATGQPAMLKRFHGPQNRLTCLPEGGYVSHCFKRPGCGFCPGLVGTPGPHHSSSAALGSQCSFATPPPNWPGVPP